jgi:tRNA uridine 5-carbamoylmethylation protein Kti12
MTLSSDWLSSELNKINQRIEQLEKEKKDVIPWKKRILDANLKVLRRQRTEIIKKVNKQRSCNV